MAVKVGAVATPLVLVVLVAAADPEKLALAPLPGAVNVTVAPFTGLPPLSFTVACSAVAKFAPTVALCGVPALAAMLPPAACNAAALIVTLLVPELTTQETVKVCPANPAE